mmetsp:Transcript_18901/g.27624  ORF Transcript_18901/g.27624 Transcript_18901/m.27624 type:complete len:423 (-) Transcript_18901:166-1434(-)
MRIGIIRAPGSHVHVQLARAVAPQNGLGGAHCDVQGDACLRKGVLQRLRNLDPLLCFAHTDLDFKRANTCRGQQFLGLFDIQAKGVFIHGAQIGARQKVLVDGILTIEKAVLHPLIVHQVFDRLPYFGLGQHFMLLVHRDIHQTAAQLVINRDALSGACACNVFGVQVAGHVNVTAFQHQPLGGAFLHVAHNDALHRRRTTVIVGVAHQGDALVWLPALQHIGARAGRVCRQPGIAQIAVDLIGHHNLFVDDAADCGGQAVQHKGGRVTLVCCDADGVAIGHNGFAHIFRGKAKLGQNERGRFVQGDHAAQRELDVFGTYRVAGMEHDTFAHCKGDGAAIIADAPAGRQIRLIARVQIERVEIDQLVIDVAADVRSRKLKALCRINGGDVVNPVGDDQHICRCFCLGCEGGKSHRQTKCRTG